MYYHQRLRIWERLLSSFKLIFIAFFLVFFLGGEMVLSPQRNISRTNPLIDRGKSLLQEGNYKESIEYFNKYLNFSSAEDQNTLECYWNLGVLFWNLDKFDESENCFERAKKLALRLNVEKELREWGMALDTNKLFRQAIEDRNKGNLPQSNKHFEEARAMARSIKSDAHELKILRTWSINYLGDLSSGKFLDLNKQALRLAQSLRHKTEVIKASKNIGAYYSRKNAYSNALSYYFSALNLVRDSNDAKEIMNCLSNIASIYSILGDNDKSIEYLLETLRISKSSGSQTDLSVLLSNLGKSYQRQFQITGNAENCLRAIECYKESLDLAQKSNDEKLKNMSLADIGNVYADLKRYDEALLFLQPALEISIKRNDSSRSAYLLNSVGTIYLKKGEYLKAEGHFTKALHEARKTGTDSLLRASFYGLGQCRERNSDFGQAILDYNECLRIIDRIGAKITSDISRAEYIQDKTAIYQTLMDLYYRLFKEKYSEAFEKEIYYTAEKAKARSFIDYLERLSKSGGIKATRESEAEEEKLKVSRMDYLKLLSSAKLDGEKKAQAELKLRQTEDMLNVMISNKFTQGETAAIFTEPAAIEVLQKNLLMNDTALMEYVLGDDRSFLLFISAASFKVIELPPNAKIYDSLIAYLKFLEDPDLDPSKGIPAARRLYKMLFYPIESLVPKSVTNLIIVPDGILYYLPFETLIPDDGDSSKNDFLIKRFTISYSPSASALYYLSRRPKGQRYSKDLLAFGEPFYPKTSFLREKNSPSPSEILLELYKKNGFLISQIPFSKKEVKDIARKFKPDKKDIYTGKQATEKVLKNLSLENYRIIHFACHAFSDENYPLRSALVLSLDRDDEEDGFLQVLEMYKMQINSDLVVLSACQTGRGKNIRNEGILGLPRIFFYMGSRSVISTLWSIGDKASAQFMKYFYANFSQGCGKTQALRLAKMRMIETRYSHPYYWGAFILTGEY
jgi:CHAT domain-containing protein/Tfp pilus assembly protein PilF